MSNCKTKAAQVLAGFALMALMFSGCSTPNSVTRLRGTGSMEIYDASYDRVWNAAVASAQAGDLYILHADKAHGFISAQRGLHAETFGENVAVWVTSVAPAQTEVEVVSRQAGPPILVPRNWEKRILIAIAADLSAS